MSHAELLTDTFDRLLVGDPWHGDSVARVLEGITAETAARHPVTGAHSIWELVLHMTGWTREVLARLDGADAGDPAGGDWPAVVDGSEAAWQRDTRALFDSHAALAARAAMLADAALERPVTDHRDRAAGTGLSKLLTLHGLAHHTVYHAGQIAVLKRAMAAS